MSETVGHYDLLEAFGGDECPVCRLTLRAVRRYIESVNYESVGDPTIRDRLRASFGFCNEHAHQWFQAAFVLGTAKIYRDVLDATSTELNELSVHRSGLMAGIGSFFDLQSNDEAARMLSPRARCLICDVRDTAESDYIDTVLEGLAQRSFADAYQASTGLCLLHLRPALAHASPIEFRILKETAIATEARLRAQLAEVIRKHDHRFSQEPVLEERGSGERAINHVAGALGLHR